MVMGEKDGDSERGTVSLLHDIEIVLSNVVHIYIYSCK